MDTPARARACGNCKHLAGCCFDVFMRCDSGNLLLEQAHLEVLERQLERSRLGRTLERLSNAELSILDIKRPFPLSFPILLDRTRTRISSEKLADRVRRMVSQIEKVVR